MLLIRNILIKEFKYSLTRIIVMLIFSSSFILMYLNLLIDCRFVANKHSIHARNCYILRDFHSVFVGVITKVTPREKRGNENHKLSTCILFTTKKNVLYPPKAHDCHNNHWTNYPTLQNCRLKGEIDGMYNIFLLKIWPEKKVQKKNQTSSGSFL